MTFQKIIRSAHLVKVVILEPIYLDDKNAESLRFRIEIFQWSHNIFTCKLWLEETYLLKPRFQSENSEWDIETCVLENGLPWREIKEKSLQGALETTINLIQNTFSVIVSHPSSATGSSTGHGFHDAPSTSKMDQ